MVSTGTLLLYIIQKSFPDHPANNSHSWFGTQLLSCSICLPYHTIHPPNRCCVGAISTNLGKNNEIFITLDLLRLVNQHGDCSNGPFIVDLPLKSFEHVLKMVIVQFASCWLTMGAIRAEKKPGRRAACNATRSGEGPLPKQCHLRCPSNRW